MSDYLQLLFHDGDVVAVTTICLLYVLLLMLLMAVRLMSKQRSSAYIMLLGGLLLMLLDSLLAALGIAATDSAIRLFGFGRASLAAISFILLNIAVLRLYKRINRAMRIRFTLLTISVPAMVFLSLRVSTTDSVNALAWFLAIWQAAMVFLCYIWIAPRILQRTRYTVSLLAYTGVLTSILLNVVIFDGMNQWLSASKHLLSLLYYTLLFFLIFERIIEQLQQTYRSSITDGLTGLFNRTYMYNRMAHFVKKNSKSAILFCDIDNFKKLNDTQGHLFADETLKQTANIIQEEVDDVGLAGRFGGEELIAFIHHSRTKPEVIAENIRKRVEAETAVTVSVGYTVYHERLTIEQFVKEADEAMYHSKQNGKNQVTAYRNIRRDHKISTGS